MSHKRDCAVLAEALLGMLDTRDFLVLQLDLEYGNIDEVEFDELAAGYFFDGDGVDIEELSLKMEALARHLDTDRLDTDTITRMFRVSPSAVNRAWAHMSGLVA